MADTVPPFLFAAQGTFNAPFTYKVPGSGEVQPQTASATFDGSGASSSFLPTLSFYAQSGNLIARLPLTSGAIPAGGSAEVTWAPFLSGPSSSSTGFTADYCRVLSSTLQTIAPGADPNLLFPDGFVTTSAAAFTFNGTDTITIPDTAANHGLYEVMLACSGEWPSGTNPNKLTLTADQTHAPHTIGTITNAAGYPFTAIEWDMFTVGQFVYAGGGASLNTADLFVDATVTSNVLVQVAAYQIVHLSPLVAS
jgi:hypothetical protein